MTAPALELLVWQGSRKNKCVKNFGHTDHRATSLERREPHLGSHREEVLFGWAGRMCGSVGVGNLGGGGCHRPREPLVPAQHVRVLGVYMSP